VSSWREVGLRDQWAAVGLHKAAGSRVVAWVVCRRSRRRGRRVSW
jgi:hypothetical protein